MEDTLPKVTWPQLAEAIKRQFQSFTGATRSLTQLDTDYIAEKMFGPAPYDDPVRQGTFIERAKFIKDYMNNVQFSCWDWFYSIAHLIKQKEILEFWNKGWLIGFISYDDATQRTMMARPSTFLLRFSEGTKGALSIAGVVDTVTLDRQRVERRSFHLSPMDIDDLKKMSLVERLQVNQDLHYLYPEIPKASILAHFGIAAPVTATPSRRRYLRTMPVFSISWAMSNNVAMDSDRNRMEAEE
uniref:SH2 domain-containing protein n=1 Tax=Plectus sambesii TaxID=2011161 RepID=A0A914UU30_9BILA